MAGRMQNEGGRVMPTLSKYDVRSLIRDLDDALKTSRIQDEKMFGPNFEGGVTWNIKCARQRLLDAVITDLDVPAVTAAEIEDASIKVGEEV